MAIGELRPFTPFTSLISGVGAGQEIQSSALRNQIIQNQMDQYRQLQAAQRTYADTGEGRDLLAVSPDLWMRLNEDQRKAVESGMKDFRETAPFWTPENYPQQREWFAKRNPQLANLLPAPDRMQTPEQIDGFVRQASNLATKIEADRQKALGYAAVGPAKKMYEEVAVPKAQLEQQMWKIRAGVQQDQAVNMLKLQQEFQREEKDKDRALTEELRSDQTTEKRENRFYTNLRSEQQKLQEEKAKAMAIIDRQYPEGEPERPKAIAAVEKQFKVWGDDVLRRYEPWAKQYNIPFTAPPPKAEVKAAPGFKGPGRYLGPDKRPVDIRSEEEYAKVFGERE